VLPFFNHAAADDYVCGDLIHKHGFLGYQLYFYKTWGGRFSANFFSSVFSANDFIYSHYYFHTYILLILDLTSFYFFIQ